MKCPVCNVDLQQDFYEKFIHFRCPGCGGRMMTVSALRNLCADRDFANRLWRAAMNPETATGPGCGSCGKTMHRVTLPLPRQSGSIELDLCPGCQTVWFDPAELESIPLPRPADDGLPPKAREILALHQIQEQEKKLNHELHPQESSEAPDEAWKYILGVLGLPVESDAPGGTGKPWLTWLLALLCIAVFAWTAGHLQTAIDEWGFIPAAWSRHGRLTLVTSMFLHGGLLHLVGNLYFLLVFGDNVETIFGRWFYLLLIAASGLCATLLYASFHTASQIPCVGASGFISGIIGCYAVSFPQARLAFCLWTRGVSLALLSGRGWFTLPAWGAFLLWLGYQILLSVLTHNQSIGGVAFLAHVGGALAGVALAIILRLRSHSSTGCPA